MGFNKKFFTTGGIVASTPPAAAAGLDPLQNFETVTYTGNGSAQKITGYIRKGAAFNGNSSEIDIPHNTAFDATGGLSFSLWINKAVLDSSFDRIMDKANGGLGNYGWEIMYNSTVGYRLDVYDTSNNVSSARSGSSAISAVGVWDHVVGTISSSGVAKLYVNGVLEDTTSALSNPISSNTGSVTIGRYFNASNGINAKLDQIRFFNTDIDQTAVDALYAEEYGDSTVSTTDFFGDGSGFALYQLDEDASDTGGTYNRSNLNVTNAVLDLDGADLTSGATTWSDNTSNNNDGAIDSATYVSDFGGYLNFAQGDDAKVTVTDSSSLDLASTITLEAWVYVTGTQDTYGRLFWKSGAYALYRQGSNGNWTFLIGGTTLVYTYNTTDEWYHIAATYDGSNMKIFINGVEKATQAKTGAITTNNNNLFIGGSTDSDRYFVGRIAQARVHSTALTDIASNVLASSQFSLYNGTPTNVNFLGMAFQPDLVVIKNRETSGYEFTWFDSIRGALQRLRSDSTSGSLAEDTKAGSLTSFDTNGFSLGNYAGTNQSNIGHVAWCWKANDTTVTDSSTGDITADIRANTDAGFSIIKYTGNNTSGATVPHGLNSQPDLVFIKAKDSSNNWHVYVNGVTSDLQDFRLNSNSGLISVTSKRFVHASFTDSVIALGDSGGTNATETYIGYCFHSVDGYQKIGSYTGNGDGSYNDSSVAKSITTGFRPRFVVIKRTDAAEHWEVFDSERKNTNPNYGDFNRLNFNLTNAEVSSYSNYWNIVDFTDTGFDLGQDPSQRVNLNNAEYLYWAIA